jgi:two-component system, NtrC family, response regulator AtoC
LKLLHSYDWPGNIRELRNAVERAMLLTARDWLESSDFLLAASPVAGAAFQLPPGGVDLEAVEQSLVIQALEQSGGNQTRAAALLGMNRDQIRYRIDKYAITRPVA